MGYLDRIKQASYASNQNREVVKAKADADARARDSKSPLGPLVSALGAAFGLPYLGTLLSGVGGTVGAVGTAMAGASPLEKAFSAYNAYNTTQKTGSIGAGIGQAAMTVPMGMAQTEIQNRIGAMFPKTYSQRDIEQMKLSGAYKFSMKEKPGFTEIHTSLKGNKGIRWAMKQKEITSTVSDTTGNMWNIWSDGSRSKVTLPGKTEVQKTKDFYTRQYAQMKEDGILIYNRAQSVTLGKMQYDGKVIPHVEDGQLVVISPTGDIGTIDDTEEDAYRGKGYRTVVVPQQY